jgi:hypothetical protein
MLGFGMDVIMCTRSKENIRDNDKIGFVQDHCSPGTVKV